MASLMVKSFAFTSLLLGLSSALPSSVLESRQNQLATAYNDSLPAEWSYVGCYNESNPRALSGSAISNTSMTGALCASYCAGKNFVYAGVEYAEECYCGNKLSGPTSLQNDTKCNMGCAGNSSEACGGPNYLTVYYANKDGPKGPDANPGPPGWTHQGCWTDGNPRTLRKRMDTPGGFSNLTVAGCTTACGSAGYTYAGVEYAGECYCDTSVAKGSQKLDTLDDCNMACNGNSSEFCGAGNRLNLYSSGTTKPEDKPPAKAPVRPVNWISMGCYSDNVNGRTLRYGADVPGGSNNMTNANCVASCISQGYTIAGTEYGGECFCDNEYSSGPADGQKVTDGRCNMACNGNDDEICGGPNGLSVLQFNGWYDQGCYADNVNGGRTLRYGQDVPGGGQNMTVENCVTACAKAKYTIAGVEYAGECFCDNSYNFGGGPAENGNVGCSMACHGNADQKCGGPDRLNVYKFDGKGLPTKTATTSTAAAPTQPANGGDPTTPPTADPPADPPADTTPTPKPSSGVNETAILPFEYQGCYTDNMPAGRALNDQRPDSDTLTVESCIAMCSARGFKIAGMEFSSQCFCDNYIRNSPTKRDDDECSMTCSGNDAQKCGAGGRLSIYSNGTMESFKNAGFLTDGLPGDWTFKGCLEDNVNGQRSLPYMMEFPKDNSNIKCMTLCQEFGYHAAGTEYGEQCFCGDPQNYINAGAGFIANSSCNIRCTNDTAGTNGGEICGGGNAISLYHWEGTPLADWTIATGDAAGAYEFLIGGVVIPLITAPARNGKVVFLEKYGTGPPNTTGTYELDISQLDNFEKAWRPLHVSTDVFCAAGLTLPDRAGRQINIGGWSAPSTEGVRLYWPDGAPGVDGKNDWEENVEAVSLLAGRWYPSAMTMANGTILVMGGEEGSNGAPVPSLEILPPSGELLDCPYLRRTDPLNLYPYLIQLPSGNIFVGYYNEALLLDPVSLQPIKQLPKMPGSVNRPDSGRTYPLEGTAVVMPQHAPFTDPLEVLICGGSGEGAATALDNCITIAPDVPGANWTLERMPSKRVMSNMAALPDGTFLIVGGAHQGVAGFGLANDPNLNAVLYDPTKKLGSRMTMMANTTIARMYHSEAVLMDDARVLISGSDPEDGKHPQEYRNEVFIPPYLMGNKPRPAMNISNLDWAYGSSNTLEILSPGSGGDYRVSMMGAVATTHGNSMGQRTYFLSASCSGGSCTVTAPPNANICPPGWFQVFLLDGSGVPSHAVWVRVGGDPARLGEWPDHEDFKKPGMGPVERLF